MPKFLNNIDLTKNQLLNAVIQNLASAPGTPVAGLIYYDTTLNQFGVYNGTLWVYISASTVNSVAAGDTTITIGGTAANPTVRVAKVLDSSWITNFDTQVRASRLDQLAAPTVDLSIGSHKLTNVLDPTNPQDATTKAYVDARAAGLDPKAAVNAATTAALAANTYANGASGVGATLTANANGALAAIDGYTPVVNDRILVKNEATAANNGIYTVTQVGTGALPYILTRATDFNQASNVVPGAFTFVENGTANGNGGFVLSTAGPWTLGTTAIAMVQFTGAGEITVTAPIVKTGNNLSLTGVPSKYATDVGNGSLTSITVTHNLNTLDIVVMVRDNTANGVKVECDVQANGVNTVVLIFAVAPTAAQYRCIVVG